MCLLFIAINRHPDYPLIIVGNRDEFYRRPTAKLSFWKDRPDLLAGRDLEAGGVWLGVTRSGRIAAITNYRDPSRVKAHALSRGLLVLDFLAGSSTPPDFCRENADRMAHCNGFNLIIGNLSALYYYSNWGQEPVALISDGLHGLSNHLLDTPWPKMVKGKQALVRLLDARGPLDVEAVFSLLRDGETAPDHALPRTGVTLDWERKLSPLFIATDVYGTRSSSVILVDRKCWVTFSERTFAPDDCGRLAVSTETKAFQAEPPVTT